MTKQTPAPVGPDFARGQEEDEDAPEKHHKPRFPRGQEAKCPTSSTTTRVTSPPAKRRSRITPRPGTTGASARDRTTGRGGRPCQVASLDSPALGPAPPGP